MNVREATDGARSLFLFALDGVAYAVEATQVRESVWLPELFPLEAAPAWIIGGFNLRGQVVPVVELGACRDHRRPQLRAPDPADQVLVLELDGAPVGLLVSEVSDLVSVPPEAVLAPPAFAPARRSELVGGAVQVDDALVTLLDLGRLAGLADLPAPPPAEAPFCFGRSAEAHAVFRSRARALRGAREEGPRSPLALAVVELAGERFGIELATVDEFCRAEALLPLPCCPPHVAGVLPRRGMLVTVLELAGALGLAPPARPRPCAVIGRTGGEAVGLAIDQVHEVIELDAEALRPAPEHAEEIRAIGTHAGRSLALLDLPALLGRAQWVVDETA